MELPRVTADLPGIGGRIGPDHADFQVEEIPAYLPSGDGPHWYVRVRKQGLGTPEVVRLLANAAGCGSRDVGFAGRKDKHAITSQWISMPVEPVDPGDARVELLEVSRHGNKLKLGHLRGNRFQIRLVDCEAPAERLPALLDRVAQGIPNYFGPQRFGRGDALQQGMGLLENPKRRVRDPRFLASVVQSAVFNRWLADRVQDELLSVALLGDILKKRETGGLFECEDITVDVPRVTAGELDPTGPMVGPKMRAATGPAGERELAAFAAFGLDDPVRVRTLGRFAPGTRRVARLVPADVSYTLGPDLVLRFTLPKGAFATTLLAELSPSGTSADPR